MAQFYKITLVQAFIEQLIVNNFFYRLDGTPATLTGSFALYKAFGEHSNAGGFSQGTPLRVFMENLSTQLSVSNIVVENIVDPVDFFATPYESAATGGVSGLASSPATGIGFICSRTRRDIRPSTKRFAGLPLFNVTDGGGILPAFINSGGGNMAFNLGKILTLDDEGNTLTFTPITIKREQYTTPKGTQAYRIPENAAYLEANHSAATAWKIYDTVRTQTSRQFGNGA